MATHQHGPRPQQLILRPSEKTFLVKTLNKGPVFVPAIFALFCASVLTIPVLTEIFDGLFGVFYEWLVAYPVLLVGGGGWVWLIHNSNGWHRVSHVLGLLTFVLLPIVAFKSPLMFRHDLTDRLTWLMRADEFRKPETFSRTEGPQHRVWREWGVFSGNVAYLVFDETADLSRYEGQRPNIPGIPCAYHVLKLEAQWYIVTFYTDTDWNFCPHG